MRLRSTTRPVAAVCGVAILVALLGGCDAYKPPPVPQAQPPQPERGHVLYDQACASCHGPNAAGTEEGPSLADAGAAGVDFMLRTGRMPLSVGEEYTGEHEDPKFNEQDINAIVDYVQQLQPGGPPIPDVQPANVQEGRKLYAATCASCHSATGEGGIMAGGHQAPTLAHSTPRQVGDAIRFGPTLMPAFPDSMLSADQVDAIAAYVQTLRNKHGDMDEGGVSLGRIGPVTEGLLAWLVAIPLLLIVVRWLGSRTR